MLTISMILLASLAVSLMETVKRFMEFLDMETERLSMRWKRYHSKKNRVYYLSI